MKILNLKRGLVLICCLTALIPAGCIIKTDPAELPKTPVAEAYKTRVWLDFYGNRQLPEDDIIRLELSGFPDTVFCWTPNKVIATGPWGEETLFYGMPIWNVFLADLNDDGLPEFCATVSAGSGIIDDRVFVYDHAAKELYELSDRTVYDYSLHMEDGRLLITQTEYQGGVLKTGVLAIVNGELTME